MVPRLLYVSILECVSCGIMALRSISRINFFTRVGHCTAGRAIVLRYAWSSVAVSGVVLERFGNRYSCCRQMNGYHSGSRTSDSWFSYNTSRIALATGLVFMLGSAGMFF